MSVSRRELRNEQACLATASSLEMPAGVENWRADSREGGFHLCSPSHWPDEMRLSRWWLALFPSALTGRDAIESLVVRAVVVPWRADGRRGCFPCGVARRTGQTRGVWVQFLAARWRYTASGCYGCLLTV